MNDRIKNIIIVLVSFLVAGAVIFGVSTVTSPIAEQARNAGEMGPAFEVMPDAKGFETLDLGDVPGCVENAYLETSGQGFVVKVATNKGYTKEDIVYYVAFSADGKIQDINLVAYPETRDFGADFIPTFVGQDSTLSGTDIVAGCTYSSKAFRDGVADAFQYLIDHNLIVEAKKEPAQIVSEMLPYVFGPAVTPNSIVKAEEFTSSVEGVKMAQKALNEGACAYWYNDGNADYVIVSNGRTTVVWDMDKKYSDAVSADVVSALQAEAAGIVKNNSKKDLRKVKKIVADGSSITQLELPRLYGNVENAFYSEGADGKLWTFASRVYGFGDGVMTMYVTIDENGAIWNFTSSSLILEADYFSDYTMPENYEGGLVGVTGTWSGDEATITGATMTSDAVRDAINDSFAAYHAVKGGR